MAAAPTTAETDTSTAATPPTARGDAPVDINGRNPIATLLPFRICAVFQSAGCPVVRLQFTAVAPSSYIQLPCTAAG